MNIPDSPDELLRQYHKGKSSENCNCNVCKASRYMGTLNLTLEEIIRIQMLLSTDIMSALYGVTKRAVADGSVSSAVGLSHLAGQVSQVLYTLRATLTTAQLMSEESDN